MKTLFLYLMKISEFFVIYNDNMKSDFNGERIPYWKNKVAIYQNKVNQYLLNSDKYRKYMVLLKRAEYNLAVHKR